jgi:phenylpyruvate tautomerase PptA (4-oxalocrotonate tautomerase family)
MPAGIALALGAPAAERSNVMPIMQVQYPENALDDTRKAELARRLTDVLIAMEGGADTRGGRAFAWVLFTPVKAADWWVGGRQDDDFVEPPGRFLVHVTIPEGYMNAAHKSEVHASVNAAIIAVMGCADEPDTGKSVLVIIDEVTEGNWGAAGHTVSLAEIAGSVGLPKDGNRFAWVQEYFGAKRRQFEAAGYPNDVGGLLSPARKTGYKDERRRAEIRHCAGSRAAGPMPQTHGGCRASSRWCLRPMSCCRRACPRLSTTR